jgi:type VI secretion system protein ImpA
LIQPLRKIPLFALPDGEMIALWQYAQSAEVATIADSNRLAQRLSSGVTPFGDIETAARANAGALRQIRSSAQACSTAWEALEAAFGARAETPSMGRVRDLLDEIVSIAARYVGSGTDELPHDVVQDKGTTTPIPGAIGGRITSREEAFRALEEIAEFFRRTEPHSPLANTLREAVRRGRLTWAELLEEIVPDFDARTAILSSLGIRPPSPPE